MYCRLWYHKPNISFSRTVSPTKLFWRTASVSVLFFNSLATVLGRKDLIFSSPSWRGCWLWRPAGVPFPKLCSFLGGAGDLFPLCDVCFWLVRVTSGWLTLWELLPQLFLLQLCHGWAGELLGSEFWLWVSPLSCLSWDQPGSWRKCGCGFSLGSPSFSSTPACVQRAALHPPPVHSGR